MDDAQASQREEQWKAEEDARTLARADMIRQDPERLKKARTAAGRLLEQESERTEEQEAMTASLARLAKKGRMGDYSRSFRDQEGG